MIQRFKHSCFCFLNTHQQASPQCEEVTFDRRRLRGNRSHSSLSYKYEVTGEFKAM